MFEKLLSKITDEWQTTHRSLTKNSEIVEKGKVLLTLASFQQYCSCGQNPCWSPFTFFRDHLQQDKRPSKWPQATYINAVGVNERTTLEAGHSQVRFPFHSTQGLQYVVFPTWEKQVFRLPGFGFYPRWITIFPTLYVLVCNFARFNFKPSSSCIVFLFFSK